MVQEAAENWTRLNVHAHTHTHILIDKFMNNSTRQFPFLDFFYLFLQILAKCSISFQETSFYAPQIKPDSPGFLPLRTLNIFFMAIPTV